MSAVVSLAERRGGAPERVVQSLAGVLVELRAMERIALSNMAHLRRVAAAAQVPMDDIERRADAIEIARQGGGRA